MREGNGNVAEVPGRRYHSQIEDVNPASFYMPSVSESGRALDRAHADLTARRKAAAASLVHRGVDEPLDIFNVAIDPTVTAILVSFTVPDNQVARINRVAVVCSEPSVAMGLGVGWRVILDAAEIPYFKSQMPGFPYFPVVFGDLANPLLIEPLWIQANQTIAIELIVAAGFDIPVRVAGRLGGRLIKPASPTLVEG